MFNLSSSFQGKPKGKEKEKEWRLFNAKDFQSVMYPCFMFCRILGIFPYKINGSTFEASKLHYILWTLVVCVYGIYSLIILYNSSIFEKIDMETLPWALTNSCVFVFGDFIMVVTFILSGPRMRLLQILSKISSRLPAESHRKLSRLIHTKDIIGFLYLIGMTLVRIFTRNVLSLFHMYLLIVIFQMDMLYINCVWILKICFKRINDNLAHMRKLMINDNPHGCRVIFHEQKNPFLIMELKDLKKQHLTISNTVQMLNMIFSLQLLATIVMSFFDITIILYYYYMFYWQIILLENTLKRRLYYMFILLRMSNHIIKIALIVWACETGKNEALKITHSIHDVLNSITDDQIKGELQLFSLQTLHCKNTFSAKGLTVDAKLLTVIVGNITTYLLILIQFFNMSYSCEQSNEYYLIKKVYNQIKGT